MVDKICDYLTKKIRKQMPQIDDEREEIINYGMHLLIGEIPKTFVFIAIAVLLGVLKKFFIAVLVIFPYRAFSGGVHFKTHISCFLATSLFYIGNAFISKNIVIQGNIKFLLALTIWSFALIMIKLYAPADTEDVPILRKKERKIKKVLSYIIMSFMLILSIVLENNFISNLLLFGTFLQTISITRIMYKLAGNKYGYEVYSNDCSL